MPDHRSALVPISAWAYNATDLALAGRAVDIGLLAEALIYYDRVLVNITTQPEFAEFLGWFEERGVFNELLALLRDGTITVYDYAFAALPALKNGVYLFVNIQDGLQAKRGSFEQRVLAHDAVRRGLPRARSREKLYKAVRGKVIEAHADDFGIAVDNAREDLSNPERVALTVQTLVDELSRDLSLGDPPEIKAEVLRRRDGNLTVNFNVNFSDFAGPAGKKLRLADHTPLNAGLAANRLLLSAAQQGCDMYLARPMSCLVGDKMYEASRKITKGRDIIESLQSAVEFPDIRAMVNADKLTFKDVLRIRGKAVQFRRWLQDESRRDRDALIAYHREVTRASGLIRAARTSLRLFGFVLPAGGTLLGPVIEREAGLAPGAASKVGETASLAAGGLLLDLASRIGKDWRPVIFGDWLRGRIERITNTGSAS